MSEKQLTTWAGRTLHGADTYGVWTITDYDGWEDSPETKGIVEDKANADGQYDMPIYNEARITTMTGNVQAADHYRLHEAGLFLTSAMQGRLQVEGHGPTLWSEAKRDAKIKFDTETENLAHWQIKVKSVDPRKYGVRHRHAFTPGSPVTVFHRGFARTLPVVQINGPLAGGFTITHPNGQYIALGDLAAGGWLRVDFRNGRLILNGQDRSDLILQANVCDVGPGPGLQFTISNGSGYVEIYDSYL